MKMLILGVLFWICLSGYRPLYLSQEKTTQDEWFGESAGDQVFLPTPNF
jgi:hypothetical protein